MFEWSATGLDFAKTLNPSAAKAAMVRGLGKGMTVVANQVREETPADTGLLRASINTGEGNGVRQMGNDLVGVVGSNKSYAPFVENGTRPHFPPPLALAGWAERVGANPFAVARAIAKKGTKARRMFGKVLESPFISGMVERFVSDELRKAIWG